MVREARVLRCSNCGGSLPEGAASCPFCKFKVATRRCVECFHMNWLTAAHCTACGQVLGLEPVPEPETLSCPACSTCFVGIPTEGAGRVLECEGCGGQFVDHSTLRGLFERRLRLSYRIEAPSPFEPRSSDRVRYLPCPICEGFMNRRNFGERSGIIVDVCRAHGIWFDPGELPRVMDFVAQGGLEEAARRELERERERVREERKAFGQAMGQLSLADLDRPKNTAGVWGVIVDILSSFMKP